VPDQTEAFVISWQENEGDVRAPILRRGQVLYDPNFGTGVRFAVTTQMARGIPTIGSRINRCQKLNEPIALFPSPTY
jgi:hypothetical protein